MKLAGENLQQKLKKIINPVQNLLVCCDIFSNR
jgi:hypothetical protein